MVSENSMKDFELTKHSASEIVEFMLAYFIMVAAVTLLMFTYLDDMASTLMWVLYYVVIPVLLLSIVVLTYRVEDLFYKLYYVEQKWDSEVSSAGIIVSLVSAVAALNLGLLMVIWNGPMAGGSLLNLMVFAFVVVVLAFALSVSLVTRQVVRNVFD